MAKDFLIRILFLFATSMFVCSFSFCSASDQPNIIFLFADDMRSDAISAFGHPVVKTPNLDQLAHDGTVFSKAITAYPICHVCRAEIFSGRSAFRSGYFYHGKDYASDVVLWPEAMKSGGYQTFYVGKWHSPRSPWKCGFEKTIGLYSSGGAKRPLEEQTDYKGREVTGYKGWTFKNDQNQSIPQKGVGLTPDISEEFANAAINVIEQKHEKPFFMQVSFTAPHDPLLVPTGFADRYDPSMIPLPKNFLPRHPFDHGNFKGRDEKLLPWPRTKNDVTNDLAIYYAIISHLDEQIGRIIRSLKKSKQYDNTIIIFSSDHGLALGSHGLMGKQNQYEHSIAVPLIFAGGGIPKNKKVDAPCYLRDLFPTTCELAKIPVPKSVDSRSLAKLFTGKADEPYSFVTGYFTNTQRMIREDRWKLIWYPAINHFQLFDLEQDPSEVKNVYTMKENKAKVDELFRKLKTWLTSQGDPLMQK